jgi:hypothetical protein
VSKQPFDSSFCVTVPNVGDPCTTMADLCGSDEACDVNVITTPFQQLGVARRARRVCKVEAHVSIGTVL